MALSDYILGKGKMLALALAGEIIQCVQYVCEMGYFVLFSFVERGGDKARGTIALHLFLFWQAF